MSVDFFGKGLKYINIATELDKTNANPEEALQNYTTAFEYLIAGLKYSRNEKVKAFVRDKLQEFMTRAEVLKKEIQAAKDKQAHGSASKDKSKMDPETEKLRQSLEDTIIKEKPNVSWKDVAGLDSAKTALEEAVILPQRFPQLFTGKRKPWKGILLYGPPGTGKTLLAKAVASATDSTFFSLSASNLVSKWMGESEKLVRELFRMAEENKPSIIFIDEIDSICGTRTDDEHDATRRIKTEFLVQMQKALDSEGILVLGATNRPFDLDAAVRRRFEKRIYIPLPDAAARKSLLAIHLGSEPTQVQQKYFDDLAKRMEGYSGADINTVVRDVLMAPIRISMKATHFKRVPNPHPGKGPDTLLTPCSPDDPNAIKMSLFDFKNPDELLLPNIEEASFELAMKNIKPSVSKSDLRMQEKFTQMYGESGAQQQPTSSQEDEEQRTRDEDQLMKLVTDTTIKLESQKKLEKQDKTKKAPTLA